MNEKNKPDDINSKTLNELTIEANTIINYLENHENIENNGNISKSLKVNKLIEKKLHNNSKKCIPTKDKISDIIKKVMQKD